MPADQVAPIDALDAAVIALAHLFDQVAADLVVEPRPALARAA